MLRLAVQLVFLWLLMSIVFNVAGQEGSVNVNISINLESLTPASETGTHSEYFEEVTDQYYIVGVPWNDKYRGVIIVLEPAGAHVELFRDNRYIVLDDAAPTAREIPSSGEYEVMITLPDQRVWRKRLYMKTGMKYIVGVYATAFSAPAQPAGQSQPVQQEPPPPPPCPTMDSEHFSSFISQLEQEPFPENKIDVLRTAARDNCFTVSQAIQIANVFHFDEDKLKAMKIVYPKLVDKQEVYRIYQVFTFPDTKEEFREWIEMQED